MTESQVLERIAEPEKTGMCPENEVRWPRDWILDVEKLAALLAEMSDRIEKLENRPVDCVSRSVGVVGTPNITPVVDLGSAPEGVHFKVTSKSYGPGEKPSQ